MKTPEDILRQKKYNELKNLTLICEAMEEYAKQSTPPVEVTDLSELELQLNYVCYDAEVLKKMGKVWDAFFKLKEKTEQP